MNGGEAESVGVVCRTRWTELDEGLEGDGVLALGNRRNGGEEVGEKVLLAVRKDGGHQWWCGGSLGRGRAE